jgi:cytoskeleton protein RodZ
MTVGAGEASGAASNADSTGAMQTPGNLLQQERKRRGLSVQQAAEALHLDAWIIEAIETNRFTALGAPVYAKGYLRKYAVMLGLAPEVIVARYDALSDTLPEPTPVPVITTTPPPRPKWPKVVGWSLLAAVIVTIGFVVYRWLMQHEPSSLSTVEAEPVVSSVVAPIADTPVQTTEPVAAVPVAETVATPQTRAPQSEGIAPVTGPQRTAEPRSSAADEATVRLTLQFTDSSWAEVYDAGGQRLFYDIGQPGRSRAVSGMAPLNVVIGVASAVSVQVNDQSIVVPRRANRDSARFVVQADGSVR